MMPTTPWRCCSAGTVASSTITVSWRTAAGTNGRRPTESGATIRRAVLGTRRWGCWASVTSAKPWRNARGLGVTLVGLDELLGRSDYLSLHAPLSDETRYVVDACALADMKPGAVLINTARGDLVDEEALVAALCAGRLGGALLDVYAQAPLPPGHALREAPNVVFSPHVAYYSDAVVPALCRLTAETVRRHLTGVVAVRSEP